MAKSPVGPLSPTVSKVLDEFFHALKADDSISGEAVESLEKLLRVGKVPKFEEIDAAAFSPSKGGKS